MATLIAAFYGHLTVLRTLVEQYGGNLLHREKVKCYMMRDSEDIRPTKISMHMVFELKRKVHSSKEAFLHQYKVMLSAAQGLPVPSQDFHHEQALRFPSYLMEP